MSGAMRKMGVYLGLVEDEHDDRLATEGSAARARSYDRDERDSRARRSERYDYDDDDRAYRADVEAEPVARRPRPEPVADREPVTERIVLREEAPARENHRVTQLHPRTYNEARQIGEEFRAGNPVIMNLTEMDDADAKRLVDFAAGLTFGLRGSIERITTKVFLLSPQKVKVTAEDKALIAEGGYPSRG